MPRMPILSDTDMSLFELKTRFVRNYFTYAGRNSKDFLLYISGPGVYDSPAILYICNELRVKVRCIFRVIESFVPKRQSPAVKRMAAGYKVLFRLFLTTGLRRDEAVNLRIREID